MKKNSLRKGHKVEHHLQRIVRRFRKCKNSFRFYTMNMAGTDLFTEQMIPVKAF